MTKKELRKTYRKMRAELTEEELTIQSQNILRNFQETLHELPNILLSYSPMPQSNEFNVGLCEEAIAASKEDIRIAWPKISMDNLSMEAHLVTKNKSFVRNHYNILEPLNGDVIEASTIDMIFIPLLAFDARGYRVGFGKGFYDRYLPKCKASVRKIGFSFFEPVPLIGDIDEFDVPLNLCITPTRIYEF